MTFTEEIKRLKDKAVQEKVKRDLFIEKKKELGNTLHSLKQQEVNVRKARAILVEVGKSTQEHLSNKIEDVLTKALRTIFDRPFDFVVRFVEKRNKSECELLIREGDSEFIPKDDMGVGVIDVTGFLLRIVLWSMRKNKTRRLFIYDEPLKAIGHDELMYRTGELIKELAKKLGIQVIIVTHEEELIQLADKAYLVTHGEKGSVVKEVS